MTPVNLALGKGIVNVLAAGLFAMFVGFDELKSVGELVVFIVGMIAVAAVVRSDVKGLKEWKESHDELHLNIAALLTELRTLVVEQQRRIKTLEEERHRVNRK